jgi:hypothetical protein
MNRIAGGLLIVVVLAVPPASARITKSKPSASTGYSPLWSLTIGSGFEWEMDSEQSEYDFPFLLEYGFTENLKLTVEPVIVYIESRSKDVESVSGFGDLETSLEYEFLHERRFRPALSLLGLIKWPTATQPDIGTPKIDYTVGLIASKDLVHFDLDLNVLYTFIGDPAETDTLEISLSSEIPTNHFLSVITEVVGTVGTGGVRGQPGTLSGLGGANAGGSDEVEGTFGLSQRITKYLKIEEGIVIKSGFQTQAVIAWEYNFAGED